MQHNHVLKKLNVDFLTPTPGSGGWGGWCTQANYLLPCSCNCDYIKFDMEHDDVLKKLNLDLLTPSPGLGKGGGTGRGLWPKYLLQCCCIRDSLEFDFQPDHVLTKYEF